MVSNKSIKLLSLAVFLFFTTTTIISCRQGESESGPKSLPMSIGYNKGYAPDQPIPFDHSLHAGTNKIPCTYCHISAGVSRHATVPSLNICMNCHLTVAADKPNIQQISKAYNSGQAIAWKKVHLLPDFVMFNHKPHIRKGFACQQCHGPVETMKKVRQHSDLSMGWCVDCHRRNNAPTNCTTCHH